VIITLAQLIACGIGPTQARMFEQPLNDAFERYHIDTKTRVAMFLAQAAHESAEFTRLEENLYYSKPERIMQVFPSRVFSLADAAKLARNPQALANRVYANRLGNGDEASGDGWKYRGRGLFQLTGRSNYTAANREEYVSNPDLVALPPDAAASAGWFWANAGCNEPADQSYVEGVTRRINGPAMLGLNERRSRFDHNMRALTA
jgi:putative chitinase